MASLRAALSARPTTYWLWMLVIALGVTTLTVAVANLAMPAGLGIERGMLGQDFLAFYSAGQIVASGHARDLYDLAALAQWQQSIAAESGLPQAASVAPWWNPPLVAWLFAPFSTVGFHAALTCWWLISVACLALAAALLTNLVRDVAPARRQWLLVPALLAVAPPAIQAMGHGQNTMLSLLLLTLSVLAWRARSPLVAGAVASLLFYKPQLAAVVAAGMFLTLGWRVIVGLMLGLVPLALLTVTTLPGSLTDFISHVPANLRAIQVEQPYLWHRHATLGAFWRFVLQGNHPGVTHIWIRVLSIASMLAVAAAVGRAWWKLRPALREQDDVALDRLITMVILATPLLMPFFFDYDLLLLAIAGVLVARDRLITGDCSRATRALCIMGPLAFAWLLFNPPLAEQFSLNLTVPLLCVLFALQVRRCTQEPTVAAMSVQLLANEEPPARLAA